MNDKNKSLVETEKMSLASCWDSFASCGVCEKGAP